LESFVNVAKYGESWKNARELAVIWDDPRDIYAIILHFKSAQKSISKDDVKLQYWQDHWPRFRGAIGGGESGWGPIDDFYNGQWKDANFVMEADGDQWLFTFNPVNVEFPEFGDFNVKYRRTLKVRLASSKVLPEVESFEVYTNSVWRRTDVSIEWGCVDASEKVWDGTIEVFNGELVDVKPLKPVSRVEVLSENSWASKVKKDETDGVKIGVWYAHNNNAENYDKTIVTVRSKVRSFSFSMSDLERGELILIKDYDVLVSRSSDSVDLRSYVNELAEKGSATVYDLISRMPEQTLKRAQEELPAKKKGIHFIVSCKGRRQKFGIDTRGTVFCPKLWNVRDGVPEYSLRSKYAGRFLWDNDTITYTHVTGGLALRPLLC